MNETISLLRLSLSVLALFCLPRWFVNPNDILCQCLKVSRQEVSQAISVFSADSVQDVARMTEAGTGCMCCRRCIKDMIRNHQRDAQQCEIA